MRINNTKRIHTWLLDLPTKDTVVDMTCGNGHDTLFLAKNFKQVIAVDIQEEAINSTKILCNAFENITYLLKDHSQIDFHKFEPIQGAIYNLGYLPHSDKSVITTPQSTIESLKNLYPIITDFIIITSYRGHTGGKEEYDAILEFLETNDILFTKFSADNPIAPCTFIIKKIS